MELEDDGCVTAANVTITESNILKMFKKNIISRKGNDPNAGFIITKVNGALSYIYTSNNLGQMYIVKININDGKIKVNLNDYGFLPTGALIDNVSDGEKIFNVATNEKHVDPSVFCEYKNTYEWTYINELSLLAFPLVMWWKPLCLENCFFGNCDYTVTAVPDQGTFRAIDMEFHLQIIEEIEKNTTFNIETVFTKESLNEVNCENSIDNNGGYIIVAKAHDSVIFIVSAEWGAKEYVDMARSYCLPHLFMNQCYGASLPRSTFYVKNYYWEFMLRGLFPQRDNVIYKGVVELLTGITPVASWSEIYLSLRGGPSKRLIKLATEGFIGVPMKIEHPLSVYYDSKYYLFTIKNNIIRAKINKPSSYGKLLAICPYCNKQLKEPCTFEVLVGVKLKYLDELKELTEAVKRIYTNCAYKVDDEFYNYIYDCYLNDFNLKPKVLKYRTYWNLQFVLFAFSRLYCEYCNTELFIVFLKRIVDYFLK